MKDIRDFAKIYRTNKFIILRNLKYHMKIKKKVILFMIILTMIFGRIFSQAMVPGEFVPEEKPEQEKTKDNDTDHNSTGEDKQKKALEEELAGLGGQKEAVKESDDGVETGSDTDASEQALDSEGEAASKEMTAEMQSKAGRQEAIYESNDKKNSENSVTPGDPVKATEGVYKQSETDLVFGNKQNWTISRTYESDGTITGSFGYGWYTNLDERIVLGTESGLEKVIKAMKDYINTGDKIISELEIKLAQAYKVSNIYNAPDVINSRISTCTTNQSRIDVLMEEINSFLNKVVLYPDLSASALILRQSSALIKTSAGNKKLY